ncbi:porin family protein [Vibrio makurazakiensis]|uniref:porin family protein n=1 Tax=Vibrio makurazakiensis TaxID=2910250 RepID=UPI003D0D6A6F
MKKTLLTLAVSALSIPSVMANEATSSPEIIPETSSPEFFIGGGLGYHGMKGELDDSQLGKHTENANGGAFHIRAGLYVTENHRVTATINHMGDSHLYRDRLYEGTPGVDAKIDLAQTEYLISYDYIHPINSQVSVFGGATAGLVNNKVNSSYRDTSDEYTASHKGSETDFTMGLQVGAQYKIIENVSVDLQYRHMFESYSETFSEGDYTTKLSIPYSNEVTISVDYRF